MPFRLIAGGAQSPWSMSRSTWRDVALRTWKEAGEDNVSLVAAGVAFYGFLALVPLLGATVLTYGLVVDPATVLQDVRRLAAAMPAEAARLVGEQLLGVVNTSAGKKGLGLAIALGIALFGARSGAGAIVTALNIAYERKERRGFFQVTLLALAMTAAAVLVAVLAAAAIAALGHLQRLLPELPGWAAAFGKAVSYLVLGCVAAAAAAALYRFGPSREGDEADLIWLTPGSVLTASLWLLLTLGFGVYVANFGHYDASYGSLGTVVVLLTWLYLSSYILLFGAELNFEFERETKAASVETVGDKPPPADPSAKPDGGPVASQEEMPGMGDEPTPGSGLSAGEVAGEFAKGRIAARIARTTGSGKVGLVTSGMAAYGLASLRHGRRPVLGISMLAGAASIAWLRRDRLPTLGIRAILFDIDGTLVDSNDDHVEAWDQAFRSEGHAIGRPAIHAEIGKGGDQLLPALLPQSSSAERRRISDTHDAVFKDRFLPRVRPFPRAADLVRAANASGRKIVLASSASKEELDNYIELLGISDVVDASTSIDDVSTSKPAPDIFVAALRKVGIARRTRSSSEIVPMTSRQVGAPG